jgi:hypothetical protein
MSAPKLYFHGTSALSVWVSYRRALNLVENIKRKNPQAERHLDDTGSREIFRQYGPLYPSQSYHERYSARVYLSSLVCAMEFSEGWEINPTKSHSDSDLFLASKLGRDQSFYPEEGWMDLPNPEEIRKCITMLLKHGGSSYRTPGAVLVLDIPFLNDNRLMRPGIGAEELATLAFLPWRAVRGVLFFDVNSTTNLSGLEQLPLGLWPRDKNITDDLRDYIKGIMDKYPGSIFALQLWQRLMRSF